METSGFNQKKLAILDDYFPNLKTGFRVSEFNYYLNRYLNCEVFSTRYDMHFDDYAAVYPQFKDRVKSFTEFDWSGGSYALFYSVFLGNASSFYFVYEMTNTPFVFELYPGGGYWINDADVDAKLIKVLQSPLLKKVIVTQKMTYDYIINKGFVSPDKVAYIYGMVTHPEYFQAPAIKKYYKRDKSTFDICFVANKYMALGLDKGYHIFIDMCKKLAPMANDIMFHVVGGFDKTDIDVSEIENRITFYGPQDHNFFPQFYSGMDIVVSPNVPFLLIPGKSYDGFPTGCCIDAALHNVGVFCTDLLNQNEHFEHGKNIFIIPPDAGMIAGSIIEYYQDPEKLYLMSALGQTKFREVFDFNAQMSQRAAVLEQFI
ncbi:Glycosyltransferase involved in cell wall bisynthesis [Sporobacter termitidis DSM 10068]|uniref:Glycosyltransferase involved in cell wall bisynthesis n=1 Tax=Sporobacter termitidis DSM 10068 TaxID=1123282 RepID=A0A1M5U980_9FIRM|nr:glycosyltransferase family 4 protein [Sporobacter termitidis]SHH59605.1 Glycosyltransferase involved in cell wall bisynthesis [Sporobacter termitidis DSM 10068]